MLGKREAKLSSLAWRPIAMHQCRRVVSQRENPETDRHPQQATGDGTATAFSASAPSFRPRNWIIEEAFTTMSLPSDILSGYVEALASSQEGEATTDEDQPEEVLAATLSSCSDLANLSSIGSTMASSESARKANHCCSTILGSALFNGVQLEAGGDDGDGDEKEWNASIKLLRLILALPESVVGDKATKRSNIAPHIVMRAVMDHSLDCCHFEGDDEYHDDESVDNMCGSSCAIDTKTILLILLGSASVRLTASDIRQTLASSSDSKIRWRRASSLAMECIGLYQRLVLERLERNSHHHQGARGNSYNEECSALINATTLFSKYVADAIFGLLGVFQEHNNTAPVEKIEAGLISATSTMTKFINVAFNQHNPILSHQLSLDLVTSCISPLCKIQLDTILMNPLRLWDYGRMTQNGDVDDSSYSSDGDEESGADARSPSEIFAEMVCGHSSADNPGGMKTHWDGVGIAFLAHHIVTDRAMLPLYSPAFYFVLLYPHSGVLLHLGQNDDEQLGSEERFAIIANGIGMLDAALELSNWRCPTNEPMPYTHISQDVLVESPLGPVGTTQLLLNTALALPDTVGSLTNGIGEFQTDQTKITKPKILGLVRKMLLCYPPLYYVRSVASLLQSCPFDYLKPVLLDLLRPALLKAADTAETKADEEVERETLDLLESCVLEEMRNHIATSDGDGSDASSGRNIVLVDIDGLISRVEQYTCAASLVRLLLIRREGRAHEKVNSTTTRIASTENALKDFHGGLCLLLDDEAFTNLFQLHLLADALGELERQATATTTS